MRQKPCIANYDLIPIEQAVRPVDGYVCIVGYWWEVWDGHLLSYHGGRKDRASPQCNKNPAIVKRLMHDGCEMAFIPVVYWKPRT